MKSKILGLLAVGLLIGSDVKAATLSYNFDDNLKGLDFSQSNNLPLFSSSLGTLTGAQITLWSYMIGNFTFTNTNTNQRFVQAAEFMDVDFSSSLVELDALLDEYGPFPTNFLYAGGSSITAVQVFGSTTFRTINLETFKGPVVYDLAGILASLSTAGGGSFSIDCDSTSTFSLISVPEGVTASRNVAGKCFGGIVYTYTPAGTDPPEVPEPGTLALLGFALAGLGLSRRRKAN